MKWLIREGRCSIVRSSDCNLVPVQNTAEQKSTIKCILLIVTCRKVHLTICYRANDSTRSIIGGNGNEKNPTISVRLVCAMRFLIMNSCTTQQKISLCVRAAHISAKSFFVPTFDRTVSARSFSSNHRRVFQCRKYTSDSIVLSIAHMQRA